MQLSEEPETYLGNALFVTLEDEQIRLRQGAHVVILNEEALEAFETWLSERRAREPD
jgi:hypothetical protein